MKILQTLKTKTTRTMTLAVVLCATVLAAVPAPAQTAFSPDQTKFGPAPPTLPAGAQLAVLEGDPGSSSGDFTVRLKMPDGYVFNPHWHPQT